MYPWKHHYGLNPETYDPVPCLQTTQKKAFKYNFERGHTKIPTNFVRVHPS